MRIEMTSPKGRRYMAKPYSNGLCWEIFIENDNYGKPKRRGKNAGETDTDKWKSLGTYPSDVYWAMKDIVEKMMCDPEENASIKTEGESISKQLEGIKKAIEIYLKKITKEVTK